MRCLAQEMHCISAEEALSLKPDYTLHSTLPSLLAGGFQQSPCLAQEMHCISAEEALSFTPDYVLHSTLPSLLARGFQQSPCLNAHLTQDVCGYERDSMDTVVGYDARVIQCLQDYR